MIDVFCKPVIKQLNINKFIETGTYVGETVAEVSIWFSEIYPEFGKIEKLIHNGATGSPTNPWKTLISYPVFKDCRDSNFKIYSVDINSQFARGAKELFSTNPNIIIECKSSQEFLKDLIDTKTITDNDNCFLYLDAHRLGDWRRGYWPLRDEMKQILRLSRFIICIDDFVVPGHPDFGYDIYGTQVCEWNYIKDIFRDTEVVLYYPKRSNRDHVGWVLIFHGYSQKQLSFIDDIPLFRGDPLDSGGWHRLARWTWAQFLFRSRVLAKTIKRGWRNL